MPIVFMQEAEQFYPVDVSQAQRLETLPVGNYIIRTHPMRGPYYERTADFELPSKLYGLTSKQAARILSTFQDRSTSTGVLLAGEKGSGKSLLGKVLSVEAARLGMPTIMVNSPMHGDGFNKLLQDLKQPCVVFFDEFEKVYSDREAQEGMLTLFDGVFPTKKLFVLTVNNRYGINEHMQNRPGRLFYAINYAGLDKQFVRDYCNDKLLNKSQIESVVQASMLFSRFNFDMLKAIVEEMNRYGETVQEAMTLLNTQPSQDAEGRFNVVMTYHGMPINGVVNPSVFAGNPLRATRLDFVVFETKNADNKIRAAQQEAAARAVEYGLNGDNDERQDLTEGVLRERLGSARKKIVHFKATDLRDVNTDKDSYTYSNAEGYTVTFTRAAAEMSGFDYYSRGF